MPDTPRLNLPLLDAAQAQKHVTLNEALSRLDALAAGRLEARDLTVPPTAPDDGHAYIVGTAATGSWTGQDGKIAVAQNGGWVFLTPWSGCTFWIEAERSHVTFDGVAWLTGYQGGSAGRAATFAQVTEFDHALLPGTVSTTSAVIPDKAVVLGVSGRVIEPIAGVGSWSLGVAGSPDRYGSGYGPDLGGFALGVTGQPQAYFGGTTLDISADSGSFTSGTIRLAVHLFEISPPALA
jgi:hypothetical protein